MTLSLGAPQLLTPSHQLDAFSCGEPSLDEWLRRRALANQTTGASRTFVVSNPAGNVFGYYGLAAGAVSHQEATSKVRRNMPDPVPVMILARLAVDQRAQGHRLGGALLQDALLRTLTVAEHAGVRALLVHAIDARACRFYQHYGFQQSALNPMTLMLPLGSASGLKPGR